MKLNGFVANVILALLLSLLGASLLMVLGMWLATWMALLVVLSVLAGCYLLWLLYSHGNRRGISLVLLGWCVVGGVVFLLSGGALLALLGYTGLLWMTRSCLRYRKPLLALVDAAISLIAIVLSIWVAQNTHSFALACWAYFFTQSLVFFVPGYMIAKCPGAHSTDRFCQAQRNAELALARLHSNHL
ncbi:MAG: hypothetical protein CMK89_13235 [Pseudomonadales bacterium]|nr:hypothetical protein [Pseudomonadales bacterium]